MTIAPQAKPVMPATVGLPMHNPAAYCLPNIISVAATNNDDMLRLSSNFGSTSVDLGAPRHNVYSTVLGSEYGFLSGTSMATPHVAGVVALVWTIYPQMTWEAVREKVLLTVRGVTALQGKTVTGGLANARIALDCNCNGFLDDLDISNETSMDINGDVIPDECAEPLGACCMDEGSCLVITQACCNGVGGTFVGVGADCQQPDCNGNGVGDECDIARGTSDDCNGNGVPDECDLSSGTSQDCNGNGVPDECDLSSGTSQDCNANNIPDECDVDNNENGVPDECELFLAAESSRYLSVTPNTDPVVPIALRVTSPLDQPCLDKFVDANGLLVGAAVFQTPAAWGTVHVHGEDIVPVSTYYVEGVVVIGSPGALVSATTWPWADIYPVGGNGVVDIGDLLVELMAFADSDPCVTYPGSNLFPCIDECLPGAVGLVDIDDVIAMLRAFAGVEYLCLTPDCVDPCGGPCPSSPMGSMAPGPILLPADISLVANPTTIAPGASATVEGFISGASILQAYQVALSVAGGTSGTLDLETLSIDIVRPNYVFAAFPPSDYVIAKDPNGVRLGAALYSHVDPVNTGSNKYLGTFTFRASADASGTFTVDFRTAETLLRDSNMGSITWDSGGSVNIVVQAP